MARRTAFERGDNVVVRNGQACSATELSDRRKNTFEYNARQFDNFTLKGLGKGYSLVTKPLLLVAYLSRQGTCNSTFLLSTLQATVTTVS